MIKNKSQITIDALLLTTVIIVGAVFLSLYMFNLFSNTQKSIQETSVFSITSISFIPKIPVAPIGTSYQGTFNINIYSSSIPSFNQLILVQNVNNNSIASSSTCPSYAMFKGFPTNGMICTQLSSGETILPEGNNQYIITYSGALYNITAYEHSEQSNGYINYLIFNQNGKIFYEKLTPTIPVSISVT